MKPSSPPAKADILVVDDNPANLRLLVTLLAGRGYKVRPAPDGRLALAAARAMPPDLILLDVVMPEMDGFEVCRRLKADARTRAIPVIFMSALNDMSDKAAAFAAGGADYIAKPIQVDELLAHVETHLALYRLRRQLEDNQAVPGEE
ncbi:MAG: response regulator [Anaerolineae bacterium]|nr:response regulator [Anaerolineae bacterium]